MPSSAEVMDMKKSNDLSRADFLSLVLRVSLYLSGTLLLAGLIRFFGFTSPQPGSKRFDLGKAADYPPGTRKSFPDDKIFLIHSGQEWRALSLVCPHLGCVVRLQEDGEFHCPCHGSVFDADGNRIQGPAPRGLDALKVEIDERGSLIVTE